MGSMGAVDVDTIQQKHVEVDIEVEGTPKALNQGDCAGLCDGFGIAGFTNQMVWVQNSDACRFIYPGSQFI